MTSHLSICPGFSPPVLRPVGPGDAEAMRTFVQALSPRSRRWRFHAAIGACSDALARQLTQADGRRHVAWVACAGDTVVGEARYAVVGDAREAEFAIAVVDAWQGSGVAGGLFQALLDSARRVGICRLYGDVADGNARMAAFLRRHGFDVSVSLWEDVEDGVVRYECALTGSRPRTRIARWLLPAWSRLRRCDAVAHAAH
jgi:GNAT superfamily N-acetyltransferase